jgi:thiamine biosynthesis protein ThiS
MEITVNGKKREYPGPPRITGLLDFLGIGGRPVVVERNLRIVAPKELEKEPVEEGDAIEIVHLVGGG